MSDAHMDIGHEYPLISFGLSLFALMLALLYAIRVAQAYRVWHDERAAVSLVKSMGLVVIALGVTISASGLLVGESTLSVVGMSMARGALIVLMATLVLADVWPQQYVGVVGRKAAWLGLETGQAEVWTHPLKLARQFRIDFRVPVRGARSRRRRRAHDRGAAGAHHHHLLARELHRAAAHPGAGGRAGHPRAARRPHVHGPRTRRELRDGAEVAWPAGLGGQYAFWDDARRAFVLSESLPRHNALVGSPWAATASSHLRDQPLP